MRHRLLRALTERAGRAQLVRRVLFAVLFAAALLAGNPAASRAAPTLLSASSVSVSPSQARAGAVITVTLDDADLNTTVERTGETVDASGVPYVFPPGGLGQIDTFTVAETPIVDADGDGDVDPADIQISISEAEVSAVSTTTGAVTLVRTGHNAVALPFTVTYGAEFTAAQDASSTPYVLPPGSTGEMSAINLPQRLVDAFAQDPADVISVMTDLAAGEVTLFLDIGQAVITRTQHNAAPVPFSVIYRLRLTEESDANGDSLVYAPSVLGESLSFRVQNPPIADMDGDGTVTASDITTTLAAGAITSVSPNAGVFTAARTGSNAAAEPFSISYVSSVADQAQVTIASGSDATGFVLTLDETDPASGRFEASFKIGSATASTNASDPSAAARPTIKALDGDTVSATYTDKSPLALISDVAIVDNSGPVVEVLSPLDNELSRAVTPHVEAKVTDMGAGVDLTDIVFHVDVDRDGAWDEEGETVAPDQDESQAISGGFLARASLPALGSDGSTEWYVSATDRIGNSGRSDASTAESGDQAHTLILDLTAPRIVSGVAGESYDTGTAQVLADQPDRMRAVFSEPVLASSVVPGRFTVDGVTATAGVVYAAFPDTVWLTVPGMPGAPGQLTTLEGAVGDAAGHPAIVRSVKPVDHLAPSLTLSVDRPVTATTVTISVASNEPLVSAPSVTVNDQTQGALTPAGTRRWELVLDGSALGTPVGGVGVKNVEASGFDMAGNLGFGGVDSAASGYPAGATRFELDLALASPALTPADSASVTVSNPSITAAYSLEAAEYAGDSSPAVTPTLATLDGVDVLAGLASPDGITWTLSTRDLARGNHTFTIQSVDAGGNVHPPASTGFTVTVDPPTPTPTPTPTPAPVPSPTPTSAATPTPTAMPSPLPTATPAPATAPQATSTPSLIAEAAGEASVAEATEATPVAGTDGGGGAQVTGEPVSESSGDATPAATESTPVAAPADGPGETATPTPTAAKGEVAATGDENAERESAPTPAPTATAAADPAPAVTPAPTPEPTPDVAGTPDAGSQPEVAADAEPAPADSPTAQPLSQETPLPQEHRDAAASATTVAAAVAPPAGEPPPAAQPSLAPTPTVAPAPEPRATPAPERTAAVSAPRSSNEPNVEATVRAIREEPLPAGGADEVVLEEKATAATGTESQEHRDSPPRGTAGSCNLPFGSASAGADSMLFGAGLMGLLIVARRRRRPDSTDPLD